MMIGRVQPCIHVCGYKFCIGIEANGRDNEHGKAIRVELLAMPGEYDHQLKWPARAMFTIKLLHQQGGANVKGTITEEWTEPGKSYTHTGGEFGNIQFGFRPTHFIEHSTLSGFLCNGTLYFHLAKIDI